MKKESVAAVAATKFGGEAFLQNIPQHRVSLSTSSSGSSVSLSDTQAKLEPPKKEGNM